MARASATAVAAFRTYAAENFSSGHQGSYARISTTAIEVIPIQKIDELRATEHYQKNFDANFEAVKDEWERMGLFLVHSEDYKEWVNGPLSTEGISMLCLTG